MNLDELKKTARRATEHDWAGRKVWLRKLSAQDHLDLFGRAVKSDVPADAEANRRATVEFHIDVVARSLADSEARLVISTEDDRSWLRKDVDYDDLVALSEAVLAHSGYAAEKKTN